VKESQTNLKIDDFIIGKIMIKTTYQKYIFINKKIINSVYQNKYKNKYFS
jgi:hypothetical protein